MAIRTPFTELFHVDHPLVLAPMGSVSGGALAAAVSEAGGLGLLGSPMGGRRGRADAWCPGRRAGHQVLR
jgi:nitronate monooxygenase